MSRRWAPGLQPAAHAGVAVRSDRWQPAAATGTNRRRSRRLVWDCPAPDSVVLVRRMTDADATLLSMPPAGAEGAVPSTLGRYRVEEELGAGGMGVVYRAFDPELRRSLAIKVVRARGGDDLLDSRARLRQEAATMAALAHRNVCQVFDVGAHEEQLWVAMELIHGETMRAWLQVARTREAVLDVVAQVCAGLHAAHTVGICHRDVKPDNVLVEAGGRAVLCDFGLSRRDDATRTSTVVAGTLAYMAPELLEGGAPTARSDQYAVAVLVHEALTGTRPRYGVASTTLPPGLRSALARALAADPAERFPSVAAFASALTAPAPPPRRRALVAVGIGALALIAATIVFVATRSPTPAAPRAAGSASQPASVATLAATAAPLTSGAPAATSPPAVGDQPAAASASASAPLDAAPASRYSCDQVEAAARKIDHPLALGFGERCREGSMSVAARDCLGAARTEDAVDRCASDHLSLADMLSIGWNELAGALHEVRQDGTRLDGRPGR